MVSKPLARSGGERGIEWERMSSKLVFALGLLISCLVSPPVALLFGLAFGLTFVHPYPAHSRKLSKFLLQASVVGLGFGMNLRQVLHAGRTGFLYTLVSITFVVIVGLALGRMLGVQQTSAFLISTGTAICGGSAIAAVGPISGATDEQMAVSLGTIFVLNAIALLTFPYIGAALGLTQSQFGLWAALAIHDTSSVVGATAKYGAVALAIGTTVKLTRALWIVPMTLATAVVKRSKARIQWPWFIAFFCLAAVCYTYFPAGAPVYRWLTVAARIGLTVTLFLIGSSLSRKTLRAVGHRPLLQGVTLWLIVSLLSCWLIRSGWIAL
jgi:uncharacterized integral membrane protein (TIGR00698 family)